MQLKLIRPFVSAIVRALLASALAMGAWPSPAASQFEGPEAPEAVNVFFPQRYSATQRGMMAVIGNASQTCNGQPATNGFSCAGAQNGLNTGLNDKFNMAHLDIDGDPATFNSTRATLNLPAAAEVTFAALYWGGNVAAGVNGAPPPNTALSNTVRLAPAGSGYADVTGAIIGLENTTGLSRVYVAYADVTEQVRGAGSGAYSVANVQAGTGVRDDNGESGGLFAGWSLIVIYRDPTQALRNFTLWDNVIRVSPNTTGTIFVQDFLTPLTGTFDAKVGVVAFEGDFGLVGDQVRLNGVNLGNALSPANNAFNGSVTNLGVPATRQPYYTNSLGFDADTFSATGILPNGSTSATILLPTNGDNFFPVAVAFAVEVFEPALIMRKSVADLNGGVLNPGDVLRYTIGITNVGVDSATRVRVFDVVPEHTGYVTGTLAVDADPGGGVGPKTDAFGDDTAEFDTPLERAQFRVGAGADASMGGVLAPAESAQVGFQVRVAPDAVDGTIITNTAVALYGGTVLTKNYEISATFTVTNIVVAPDLSISKTDGDIIASPADTVVFTLTVQNKAPVSTADGVVVTETLPDHTTFVGPETWQLVGDRVYGRSLESIPAGGTRELTFAVRVNSDWPVTLTHFNNIAVVRDNGQKGLDIVPGDNIATETTPVVLKNLSISKTDGGVFAFPGDVVVYTLTVLNTATRTAAYGVIVTDVLPALTEFVGPPAWQSAGDGRYVRTIGTVLPGASAELTLAVRLASAWPLWLSPITNTAFIADDGLTGPELSQTDNTATDTTPVLFKNLSITKTDGGVSARPGNVVVYTLTARNASTLTAVPNVVITDVLPPLTTLVGPDAWQPVAAPGTVWRSLGSLGPSESRGVTIAVRLATDWPFTVTVITNTAIVGDDGARGPETDTTDDVAVETTPLIFQDLAITKTDGGVAGGVGGVLVYTLTARNKSAATATGVVVTDALPGRTTFVGPAPWSPAGAGVYARALGTLAPGAQTQFTMAVRLDDDWPLDVTEITNTAFIRDDGVNGPDLAPADNVAIETTPVQFADLSITKTNGVANLTQAGYTTYTIVVRNHGGAPVVGARVIDELPDDLINARWSCAAGPGASCAPSSGGGGIDSLVNLAAGSAVTFTLSAQVVACEGFVSNSARVVPPSGIVDPNPDNNFAIDVDTAGVGANVLMDFTASPARAYAGDRITFTLTVANFGPEHASAVTVTYHLPPMLGHAGSDASQGAHAPVAGRWVVGALPAGATATLRVVAVVSGALDEPVEVESIAKVMAVPIGNTPRYASVVSVLGGPAPDVRETFLPAIMR